MERAMVLCDSTGHLRALVCRLVANKKTFEVEGASGVVAMERNPDDPLYLDRLHAETSDQRIHFFYDEAEAKGRLTIGPGGYGPVIEVDGKSWAYVDMFGSSPIATEDGSDPVPPQLLLYSPHNDDELWAKVVVDSDGRMAVIVHRESDQIAAHPRTIHSDQSDYYFLAPGETHKAGSGSDPTEDVEEPDRSS